MQILQIGVNKNRTLICILSDKLNLNCKHHFFETEIFWIFREGGARKRHRFVSKINNIPCE